MPLGNVLLRRPEVPPGFWLVGKPFEQFVVTRKEPKVERNFLADKAATWDLSLKTADGKPIPQAGVFVMRQSGRSFGKYLTDERGEGHFSLPFDDGKFTVSCSDKDGFVLLSKPVTLDVKPGFDGSKVLTADESKDGNSTEVVDNAGRKARIEGGAVRLRDVVPQILFVDQAPKPPLVRELVGRVNDKNGQPIKDAQVSCASSLAPPSSGFCRTDEHGEFHFRGFVNRAVLQNDEKPEFRVMVFKDGYVSLETKPRTFAPDHDGIERLHDPIVLARGYSIRLRVLSQDGSPVEGAWVHPTTGGLGGLAAFTKSDEDGYCLVRSMPEGFSGVSVSYGDESARQAIDVSPSSSTEPAVIIRLKKLAEATHQAHGPPKPVKAGEQAPEWAVSGWTDGKKRKLSDLRGQVVFIDFWGLWCGPCMEVVPALKALQDKYEKQVVFIGIHTAGTEMNQVKKALDMKDWRILVGLDAGPQINKGETAQRFGVRGYPAWVVVDKQGRVAFNSSSDESVGNYQKVMAKMKAVAEEMKLPWPIEKDASADEVEARFTRMQVYMLSKEIEAALATK